MTERVSGGDVYVENATEDVVVEGAEDVVVEAGSVDGKLVIESAHDVIVKGGAVTVRESEDVNVESGAAESGDVTVENARDVVEDDGGSL